MFMRVLMLMAAVLAVMVVMLVVAVAVTAMVTATVLVAMVAVPDGGSDDFFCSRFMIELPVRRAPFFSARGVGPSRFRDEEVP